MPEPIRKPRAEPEESENTATDNGADEDERIGRIVEDAFYRGYRRAKADLDKEREELEKKRQEEAAKKPAAPPKKNIFRLVG